MEQSNGNSAGTEDTHVQPASTPAEYLQQLEHHMQKLTQNRETLFPKLIDAAGEAYQAATERLGGSTTGLAVVTNPKDLIHELSAVQRIRQYISYLQDLQALVHQAEKAGRTAERAVSAGSEASAILQAASEAVELYSHAMGYVIALQGLEDQQDWVQVPSLGEQASALYHRVGQIEHVLHTLLSKTCQAQLQACNWPPPLVAGGSTGADPSTASSPALAGGGQGSTGVWPGFAAADPAVVQNLQHLFTVLLTLQRATEHKEFAAITSEQLETSSSLSKPVLWPAIELSLPISEQLIRHFASGLPTDRPDKPEWLFAFSLKAIKQTSPHAEAFQPCIEAHGLQEMATMSFEMAEAVQEACLLPLLRSHILPRLTATNDPALWLHYSDEAARYERKLSILRGNATAIPLDDEEDILVTSASSCIEVLFEKEDWRDGWMEAEAWDASRQVEAACEAPKAWSPAWKQLNELHVDALEVAGGSGDGAGGSAGERFDAWQHEFCPPACAEQTVSILASLMKRCGWIHSASNRKVYIQRVPHEILTAFHGRLATVLATAEQFRDMLGETWLPKVGSALCAAHFVEYSLTEPNGPLLLAEISGSGGGEASATSVLFERESAMYSSLKRHWCYKLAKLAVDQFQKLFVQFKRDMSLYADPEASSSPAGVSPRLLPAIDGLRSLLHKISGSLDAVVFRDVWKAIAVAVNLALFNDVATEAVFSLQGAALFEQDLSALVGAFSQYTQRAAACFKESRDACKLLSMEAAEIGGLMAVIQQEGEAAAWLEQRGIKSLNSQQASGVIVQRQDYQGYYS